MSLSRWRSFTDEIIAEDPSFLRMTTGGRLRNFDAFGLPEVPVAGENKFVELRMRINSSQIGNVWDFFEIE